MEENCQKSKLYLQRFDEILYQMKDKMFSQDVTNSITVNFIVCMIPHHQAAIYMCESLLKYTKYRTLIKIADNIIRTQTKGIEQMKEILNTTDGYTNSMNDVNAYMTEYFKITKRMVTRMENSFRCTNINLDFVSEMVPHHEGAIEMCNNLLKYRIDPRLKVVAQDIIKEQSKGVEELKDVRKSLCQR